MDDGIDWMPMLSPLPHGEGGAGHDLRQDYSANSLYQKLRDARAEARAAERAQDAAEDDHAVPQQWRDVKQLGLLCLAEQTKDLEIAAWLAEALVRLDGMRGLRDSARLLAGLLEQYWDHVFPLPDEDGQESRAAPLAGLSGAAADGTLMQPLRRMPLFTRANGGEVSLYTWRLSEETAALTDPSRREARYSAGVPELALLEREAASAKSVWPALGREVAEARAAWNAFDVQATARFGDLAPSTRRVTDVLDALAELSARFGGSALVPDARPPERASEPPARAERRESAPAAPSAASTVIEATSSREQAIERIEELARFFRRTEPHSPLSYSLETLARRARLPLPALLEEVLSDPGARHAMLSMLGIHRMSAPAAAPATARESTSEQGVSSDSDGAPKGIVW